MSKKRKRKAGLLAAAACLATALLAAPVSAEITDAEKDALAQTVQDYFQTVLTMSDDYYEELREAGGFYTTMVDALESSLPETGALVSVGEVRVEDTDTSVVCTADVDFEKNDAEVVMTFDAEGSAPQNFQINVDYPLGVRLGEAGMNTVIGLVVVFAILFFLTGVIYLFRYINRDTGQKPKTEQKKQVPPVQPAAGPVSPAALAAPGIAGTEEDVELAIVLAAAIAMAEEEEPSGDGYVVRSVRKAGTSRRWKRV